MSSQSEQALKLATHSDVYPAIDPSTTLSDSAAGKVVFLAGASRGIGRATAAAFAKAGARAVYVTGRDSAALEATMQSIEEANAETERAWKVCDVTSNDQVRAAVEDCVARFGGIDVADCNAGYLDNWVKIAESDPESWWTTWEVNVRGTYHVVRHATPHLISSARRLAAEQRSGGHLILVSSRGAQMVMTGASDYQTSKHAINRLCEFVNADHGEDGLKCFAINPGGVRTALAINMPVPVHAALTDDPALAAGFAVWLCSGQADWARGRYLDATWDVDELQARKDEILRDDLLVNRLRVTAASTPVVTGLGQS